MIATLTNCANSNACTMFRTEPDLHRAVEQAHLLIVAVRPDGVHDLLRQIREVRLGQVPSANGREPGRWHSAQESTHMGGPSTALGTRHAQPGGAHRTRSYRQ